MMGRGRPFNFPAKSAFHRNAVWMQAQAACTAECTALRRPPSASGDQQPGDAINTPCWWSHFERRLQLQSFGGRRSAYCVISCFINEAALTSAVECWSLSTGCIAETWHDYKPQRHPMTVSLPSAGCIARAWRQMRSARLRAHRAAAAVAIQAAAHGASASSTAVLLHQQQPKEQTLPPPTAVAARVPTPTVSRLPC